MPQTPSLASRRTLLRAVGSAVLAPLAALPVVSGCAALVGDQTVDAWFRVLPRSDGTYWAWTEITLSSPPEDGDEAVLVRVGLVAPAGYEDLTFLQTVLAEAVLEAERVPLAEGGAFPAGDAKVPLEIIHRDGLRRFFVGDTMRIEWAGVLAPGHGIPPEGMRVYAEVIIEVL